MSDNNKFTIGDTRHLDVVLTRDGTPVNLTEEVPELRFLATGKHGVGTYGFSRNNLTPEGGIATVDAEAGSVRISWGADQTAGFPTIAKDKCIELTLELEMRTTGSGVETVPLSMTKLRAFGQLIV